MDNNSRLWTAPKDLLAWQAETAKTNGSLQATGHSVENSYQNHTNLTSAVTEKVSGSTVAQNTVTYQNGEIRTVSDGAVKYGIEKDFVNDKVTYSVFEGVNSATANKVQEDHVSDYYENDDEILVKTYERKFFNKDGDETSSTATDVDVYGRVQTTYKSGVAGGKTQYVYNDSSESTFASTLHRKYEPDGNYTEFSYDDNGNLIGWAEKQSAANGGATRFDVTQVSADTTRYTIGNNKLFARQVFDSTKTISPRLTSTTYYVDALNDEHMRYHTAYFYDSVGNLSEKTESSARSTSYAYKNIGGDFAVESIHHNYGVDVYHGYDGNITCDYNADGSLKKTTNAWSYGYYSESPSYSGTTVCEYTYDSAHRLTSETNDTLGLSRSYTYKTDGRIDKIVDSTKGELQFHYDQYGRLEAINTAYVEFLHDHFGNRTKKITVDRTDDYTYNNNLLTKVDIGYTKDAEYKYNSDGVRCRKTVDGVTTNYFLDGNKILGEEHVSNNSYNIYFIYDATGIDKMRIDDYAYKYVKDQQNNVVALLNHEGRVISRYEYDSFGNCKVFDENGVDVTNTTCLATLNPFRWKSFYFDAETGLYYANGRYYDPETGLYLNAAPMESIANNVLKTRGLDRNYTQSSTKHLIRMQNVLANNLFEPEVHWKNSWFDTDWPSFAVVSKDGFEVINWSLSVYKGTLFFDRNETRSIYISVGNAGFFVGLLSDKGSGINLDASVIELGYAGEIIDFSVSALTIGFSLYYKDGKLNYSFNALWYGVSISIDLVKLWKLIFGGN